MHVSETEIENKYRARPPPLDARGDESAKHKLTVGTSRPASAPTLT